MAITITGLAKRLQQQGQRVQVNATSVGTAILPTDGLLRSCGTNFGLRCVVLTGSAPVELFFSFDAPELALKTTPGAQAAVTWVKIGTASVTPDATGAVVDDSGFAPSAIKLVFSGPGSAVLTAN